MCSNTKPLHQSQLKTGSQTPCPTNFKVGPALFRELELGLFLEALIHCT